MAETIKSIDEKHIAIIETTVNERLVSKSTLEAQKAEYLSKIMAIDEMLLHFVKNEGKI